MLLRILCCLSVSAGAYAQGDLGLSPNQQPLFNPAPVAPAPTGIDQSLTNLFKEVRAAQQATKASPDVFDSTMWKAFMLAEEAAAAGDWQRSDSIILKMHQLVPENIMLTEKAAHIYFIRGAYAEAQEIYLKRFARNPEDYGLLTQIGKCSLYLGDLSQAIKSLKIVSRLSERNLEARFYLALATVKNSAPADLPAALGSLTIFEMSTLCYWLAAEHETHLSFLGETGYLQFASYILGGGQEGSLEVENIDHVAKQLLEVYHLLNRLDRHFGQKRYSDIGQLLTDAYDRGVRGHAFEIYQHIHQAISEDGEAARESMNALAQRHPDRPLTQHFHGTLPCW